MKRKALFIGYVGLVVVAAVYCTLFLLMLDCEWCDEEFCAEFSEDHGGTMCTKCYNLWVGVAHQVYSKS